MLLGSFNHVSNTVSDLDSAMKFFTPLLEFLGYTVGEIASYQPARTRLVVNLHRAGGQGFNVWEAHQDLKSRSFRVYEPGLHHVAFNVSLREQVDQVHGILREIGAEILDGPGEFPFAEEGYYALFFLGPDRLKFEIVHMPEMERRYREKELLSAPKRR